LLLLLLLPLFLLLLPLLPLLFLPLPLPLPLLLSLPLQRLTQARPQGTMHDDLLDACGCSCPNAVVARSTGYTGDNCETVRVAQGR
jgi:hypothetical protein